MAALSLSPLVLQTVEAAYLLAQQHLLEGLSALKEECRSSERQQEVLMLSDMDQIVATRRRLEEAVRGSDQSQPGKPTPNDVVWPAGGSKHSHSVVCRLHVPLFNVSLSR